MLFSELIEPRGDGTYAVNLPAEHRELLKRLVSDMKMVLTMGDTNDATRLFPTAHVDDEAREAEYQRLTHDPLLESHLTALDAIEETVDADVLDEAQLTGWMRAFNGIRLVMGDKLDVTEESDGDVDPGDPHATEWAVYEYLGYLLEVTVNALTTALPEPRPNPGT